MHDACPTNVICHEFNTISYEDLIVALEILGNNFFILLLLLFFIYIYTGFLFTQTRSIDRPISSAYLCFIY